MRVDYQKEIVESPEELSELEKSLRAKRAWPRARMLWLLKTGTVATVVDCAILLGYTWNQLQRWWKTYKEAGLDGLLEVRSPPGRPSRVTADAMEDLKEKMERGEISTLAKTREYLKERWGIEYETESGVWRMFNAADIKKKTGRRRHPDADPDERDDYKRSFVGKILGVDPVFAVDEARFGLITHFRRRWCPPGVRPPWIGQIRQEYLWLYAAVEPVTGESLFWFLPALDKECFEFFLQRLNSRAGGATIGVVMDGAPAHRNLNMDRLRGMVPIPLPAYSPELNPVERLFEEIRENTANRAFSGIGELERSLTGQLRKFWDNPEKMVSLTAYPWWRKAFGQKEAIATTIKIFRYFKELVKGAAAQLLPRARLQPG